MWNALKGATIAERQCRTHRNQCPKSKNRADGQDAVSRCHLADLYDKTTMPLELWKAYQPNDKTVMIAYGLWDKLDAEPACEVGLMEIYSR